MTPVVAFAECRNRSRGPGVGFGAMDATTPPETVTNLRAFAGRPVRVRLVDGTECSGTLRTELLTERSISVFLSRADGEGETIYIDQIGDIAPDER